MMIWFTLFDHIATVLHAIQDRYSSKSREFMNIPSAWGVDVSLWTPNYHLVMKQLDRGLDRGIGTYTG